MTLNWQAMPQPENAEQLAHTITAALDSGDIAPTEHSAFLTGYIGGICYTLAKLKEPNTNMGDIHAELAARITQAEQL